MIMLSSSNSRECSRKSEGERSIGTPGGERKERGEREREEKKEFSSSLGKIKPEREREREGESEIEE